MRLRDRAKAKVTDLATKVFVKILVEIVFFGLEEEQK